MKKDKMKLAVQIGVAERGVKRLKEVKQSRIRSEKAHGYKVKPNETETNLQKRSISKERLNKAAKKEHLEHQKDLKPLLKHLKADEKKLIKKKGKPNVSR